MVIRVKCGLVAVTQVIPPRQREEGEASLDRSSIVDQIVEFQARPTSLRCVRSFGGSSRKAPGS